MLNYKHQILSATTNNRHGPSKNGKVSKFLANISSGFHFLDPILNLQLQHQSCSRLVRFMKVEETTFVFKPHQATRGVVNFYSAGVVTHDRRICSWSTEANKHHQQLWRMPPLSS
jgi:hypothetical protein